MVEFIKPYPVIFEPTSEGFSVYSPVLDGCVSFGKDIEVGLANIKVDYFNLDKKDNKLYNHPYQKG